VVATARRMLKAKGLLRWFWGEAMSTGVYMLNMCLTKSVNDMTLFEAWQGKTPVMHQLRTFGCIVYVRNTTPHLKKLEDRDRKMIFVSFETGSKAYRVYNVYNPVMKHVHVMSIMVVNE
jgi:hypothetical protein